MTTSSDAEKVEVGPNEVSGNVRISILPSELIVTIPAARTTSSIILPVVLFAFFLYKSGEIVLDQVVDHRGSEAVFPVLVLLLFFWIAFQISRQLFGQREVFHCTDDQMRITNSDFGYAWRRRSFFKRDIKQIEFAAVGFSKYGAITGLRFSAAGKQIKCLRGLRVIEANKILIELKNLGFDTKVDVAMPMMMDIEESRRKSFWGLLG